jgi:hypothetical protein
VTDYKAMDAGTLFHELGGDGAKWAEAFRQYHPDCNIDDADLLCWFCNACMGGYDRALGNPPLNGDHAQWLLDHESGAQPTGVPKGI